MKIPRKHTPHDGKFYGRDFFLRLEDYEQTHWYNRPPSLWPVVGLLLALILFLWVLLGIYLVAQNFLQDDAPAVSEPIQAHFKGRALPTVTATPTAAGVSVNERG